MKKTLTVLELTVLIVLSTSQFCVAQKTTSAGLQYDGQATCDLGESIRRSAIDLISDDVAHGRHLTDIKSQDGSYIAGHLYEFNGVVVEWYRQLIVSKVNKVHLPAIALPRDLLVKGDYIKKLDIKGIEPKGTSVTVECDAETISVNFAGDDVSEVMLEISLD